MCEVAVKQKLAFVLKLLALAMAAATPKKMTAASLFAALDLNGDACVGLQEFQHGTRLLDNPQMDLWTNQLRGGPCIHVMLFTPIGGPTHAFCRQHLHAYI